MTNFNWLHARLTLRSPMPRKPPTPITMASILPDESEMSSLMSPIFSVLLL